MDYSEEEFGGVMGGGFVGGGSKSESESLFVLE